MEEGGNAYTCLHTMFTYTYAGFRIINMQIEKKDKHMRRVMRITRPPYQRHGLNSQRKKKENRKVVMNTKSNTNYAALATQAERQVENKTYTNKTDS